MHKLWTDKEESPVQWQSPEGVLWCYQVQDTGSVKVPHWARISVSTMALEAINCYIIIIQCMQEFTAFWHWGVRYFGWLNYCSRIIFRYWLNTDDCELTYQGGNKPASAQPLRASAFHSRINPICSQSVAERKYWQASPAGSRPGQLYYSVWNSRYITILSIT